MIPAAILVFTAGAFAILMWVVLSSLRPERPGRSERPKRASGARPASRAADAPKANTAPIERSAARVDPFLAAPVVAAAPAPNSEEARTRDRYIALRFQGLFRAAADLDDPVRVIETARHYFEDEEYDRANELLDLAIDRRPRDKAMRLAQLEIAFLERNAERYLDLASRLREAIPDCGEWPEIQRLGRTLIPQEPLFAPGGEKQRRHAYAHYGPWPDMPNWIGASWDLTAEVRGSELHQAMAASPEPRAANPENDDE